MIAVMQCEIIGSSVHYGNKIITRCELARKRTCKSRRVLTPNFTLFNAALLLRRSRSIPKHLCYLFKNQVPRALG